ncbi:MAG TPA: GNAT family N-acetyltransferase [Thermoanaerobaculia bacterium]|nr:GNAT family N-acetyltransferase [Thermoanaerobaculia bacterium]
MTAVRFKIASEASELEQIHRLNHATFAEEIPQHPRSADGILIDRFHGQNTYVIALDGDRLAGMLAVRTDRPFSLDTKVPDLDSHLPEGRDVCEIRLLAVASGYRRGTVFRGLMRLATQHCLRLGFDTAVISATVRQLKLYGHMGFKPFGPLVGTPEAQFQPMYLTLEAARERWSAFEPETVRLLPGPLTVHPTVRRALAAPSVPHRCGEFAAMLREVKARLRELAGTERVSLLFGSGTLANDAVAAQISREGRIGGMGLVLANGEFGERLCDHARRFGLAHSALRTEWGSVFDYDRVDDLVAQPDCDWVWAVHCETSTGVLNDLDALGGICRHRGKRLYLDCISSIGTVPVNLSGVRLASGVSGKGFGSFAGVSMVFHDHAIAPAPDLPRYLDLGCYGREDEVPYTFCSNLVAALRAALDRQRFEERFSHLASLASWLRASLRDHGLSILAPDAHASPAVTTIVLPPQVRSYRVGSALEERGYELSYTSSYLRERNWIQICLMGEHTREELAPLPRLLSGAVGAAVQRGRLKSLSSLR